jgi:hypothetical protein
VTAIAKIRAAAIKRRMCTPRKFDRVRLTDAGSVFPRAGLVGKSRATGEVARKCPDDGRCKFYVRVFDGSAMTPDAAHADT